MGHKSGAKETESGSARNVSDKLAYAVPLTPHTIVGLRTLNLCNSVWAITTKAS